MNIILILLLASVGLCYGTIPCPGGQYRCEDKQTCCQMPNEEYGCCPFPQATCCKDHTHCCPSGMKCDLHTQSCKKGDFGMIVPMKMRESAKLAELSKVKLVETSKTSKKDQETCPDGKPCASNFTCCPLTKGGFGCCPLKDAICCTDSIHCCPQGYTCNTTLGTCDKAGVGHHFGSSKSLKQSALLIEVKPTLSAKSPIEKEKEKKKCRDPKYECDDQYTCCKAAGGGYGCCPLPKAICCKDEMHCCPHGYKCDKTECLPDQINVAYNPFFN